MTIPANKSTEDNNSNNKKQISTEFPFQSNFVQEDEMAHYREPFRKPEYRKPLWRWPNELPIEGKPEDVTKAVSEYNQKLQLSKIPKLLLYAEPGGIITKPLVDWCVKNLSNLTTANIGAGIHFVQEDNPHAIGLEIAKWYESISAS
jgi:haloalkane dehalogenase